MVTGFARGLSQDGDTLGYCYKLVIEDFDDIVLIMQIMT